ncbi:hypothetical protein B0T19DRAFT_457490 [Cercophora scortea]|uniref:Uncharacterized protein n=1 Tax=Cercophora scortea TaxID=314031 RepID=A0AAE0IY03_9PEZI|nr:hypothetical protein B0T19DRAFT_457490 [Cercophora scortea]
MPPKRAPPAASGTAKKSRPSTDGTDGAETSEHSHPDIPRSKRWATVSASANTDIEYKMATHNPITAYEYVCICKAPFPDGEDEDEDEDEEADKDDDAKNHPDHPWKLTVAGKAKTFNMRSHCDLRDPDNFNMYTFNDHMGYGVVEVIQNIFLDYEEAAGNWKEQWAICEGLAFFMPTGFADPIVGIDDGELAGATFELTGRLFVSTLAHLERENQLSKDSEVKNLGLIMALFLKLVHDHKDYGFFESSRAESIGPAKDKKKWSPHRFVDQVVSYAHKYDIAITGPKNAAEMVADCKMDAALPLPESNTAKADVFGFAKALKNYTNKHGGVCAFLSPRKEGATTRIGGDYLDITSWTPAERKKHAFNKKDPLGKKEIDAIKEGLVLGLA